MLLRDRGEQRDLLHTDKAPGQRGRATPLVSARIRWRVDKLGWCAMVQVPGEDSLRRERHNARAALKHLGLE